MKEDLKRCRAGVDDVLVGIEELKFVVFPRPDDHEGVRDLQVRPNLAPYLAPYIAPYIAPYSALI